MSHRFLPPSYTFKKPKKLAVKYGLVWVTKDFRSGLTLMLRCDPVLEFLLDKPRFIAPWETESLKKKIV